MPQKFLHELQIGHGYLAHTPTGTGVPQKNFNRENLKIRLKIQRVHVNNFGTNWDIITNFYPHDVSRARGDNVGTIFGWPAH